jgi:hypothetical protein
VSFAAGLAAWLLALPVQWLSRGFAKGVCSFRAARAGPLSREPRRARARGREVFFPSSRRAVCASVCVCVPIRRSGVRMWTREPEVVARSRALEQRFCYRSQTLALEVQRATDEPRTQKLSPASTDERSIY